MSASAPTETRISEPSVAVPPLRVVIRVTDPARADRLRTALALTPELHVTDCDDADLLVLDARPPDLKREPPLTPREREVLELLALGASNKAIARGLGISLATTKFHVAAVFAKLGAHSRSDAVAIGMRRGILML